MCGIYGIFSTNAVDRAEIERMGAAMRHRGPDDSGFFADRNFAMGMQRLAIIDVDHGQQPMFSEDGQIAVVCNGEIYNFRELRQMLRERGHTFASNSDSEVVVHLYEEYGPDCVKHLSGMFGLAIWDKGRRCLTLARDRLGIKPLYLAISENRIIFASELKAILEVSGIEREIDMNALDDYLALGYVPAPQSMLKGISKLVPGTYLVADADGHRVERYWWIPKTTAEHGDENEWIEEIVNTIENAVVSQMVSDVPLGAFLSGGIDSSAVVAFMSRNSSRPVKTYSIGFDSDSGGSYYNELPYARQVAERFATDHHEIIVRPDVAALLPELVWHLDEPVADAAYITTYLVSEFARKDVTVILSGVGGDELFGGYRRYLSEYYVNQYQRIPGLIRRALLQPFGRMLPSDRNSRIMDWSRLAKGFLAGAECPSDLRYESYVRVFDAAHLNRLTGRAMGERSPALVDAFAKATSADATSRLMDVDLRTQLPDDLLMLTDRMSMATSLECRVPLLDDRLVELCCRMPSQLKIRGARLKHALKHSLRGILPDAVIDRRKRGFGAPVGGWFKNELAGYLETVLSRDVVDARGLFNWDELERTKALHRSNRQDYTDHLSSLVNLEIWCQLYLDGDSPGEVVARLHEAQAA